jgi:hypothetical protein
LDRVIPNPLRLVLGGKRCYIQTRITSDDQRGVAYEFTFLHNKGIWPITILTKVGISSALMLTLLVRCSYSLHAHVDDGYVEEAATCIFDHANLWWRSTKSSPSSSGSGEGAIVVMLRLREVMPILTKGRYLYLMFVSRTYTPSTHIQ